MARDCRDLKDSEENIMEGEEKVILVRSCQKPSLETDEKQKEYPKNSQTAARDVSRQKVERDS